MYQTVQFIHSYWAYLVLAVLVIATFNSLMGFFSKREYGAKGYATRPIYPYYNAPAITNRPRALVQLRHEAMGALGEENLMSDSTIRKAAIEHPAIDDHCGGFNYNRIF